MTILRALSRLLLLLLLTAAVPAAPQPTPKDTPAVAAVRQFLADRAAGKFDAAYGLLSPETQAQFSAAQREQIAKSLFVPGNLKTVPPALLPMLAMFGDLHDTLHFKFRVLSPAPEDPRVVLVRAYQVGTPLSSVKIIRLVTVPDVAARGAVRIDFLKSEESTVPEDVAKAQRASSQSNMKQLSLGIIQYAFDHDNNLPDADKWVDEILPYLQNSKALLRDPSAPAGEEYSYAFNRALAGATLKTSPSPGNTIASVQLRDDGRKVEAPSTVLLFESTAGIKNASDTGQSMPKPGRHLGGTDYAFADGHVKWLPDGTTPSFALTGKPEAP